MDRWSLFIDTNANPRGRPVSRAVMTATSSTAPCAPKASYSEYWVVE